MTDPIDEIKSYIIISLTIKECALLMLPISLVSNNLPLKCPVLRCVLRLLAASITPGELETFSLTHASCTRSVPQHHHVKPGSLDSYTV